MNCTVCTEPIDEGLSQLTLLLRYSDEALKRAAELIGSFPVLMADSIPALPKEIRDTNMETYDLCHDCGVPFLQLLTQLAMANAHRHHDGE